MKNTEERTVPGEGLHAGHRDRIRERFRSEGLSAFSEHEVLELLLTYAIPQKDVNPLAHELIRRFGSLSAVLEADEEELTRVDGIGKNAALLLTLMPPLLGYYQLNQLGEKPLIRDLAGAKAYCGALFLGAQEERAYMLCLDQSGRLIHPALLHRGTLDTVALYPREAAEIALRYHAHAVLLAHNHPGGIREPSRADYDTTKMVIRALNALDICVIDHLILSGDSVYSMAKDGKFSLAGKDSFSYVMRSRADSLTGDRPRTEIRDGFLSLTEKEDV